MKYHPADDSTGPVEFPFECELPLELNVVSRDITYYGHCLEGTDSSATFVTQVIIDYSSTAAAAVTPGIEEYIDRLASGKSPGQVPCAPRNKDRVTAVSPFDNPLILQDGYPCFYFAMELVAPDGQVFSSLNAKALLGDATVDFRFDAPAPVEEWKTRWLSVLLSFRMLS